MIKSFTITNALGESLKLELGNPEKSGFFVLQVEGLTPPKANIAMTELSTMDGALYNSSRATERNIVFTLGFLPKPTIEDTRHKTYKYFPIKKRIKIVVETDRRICEIYGYVESNESTIFSNMTGTTISIICPDPYFYSTGENAFVETIFYGVVSLFEFPFSNEGELPQIEFGEHINIPEQLIYYNGDIDTGIYMYLHASGLVKNITIYNMITRETFKIDTDKLAFLTGAEFNYGDTIEISTIKGNKSIYLFRNGRYINIINCVDRNSDWFQLTKGDNVFAYTVEFGEGDLELKMMNSVLYEGV